jgi:hypothetical protein
MVTPNLMAICLLRAATGVFSGRAGRPSTPADAMHSASIYHGQNQYKLSARNSRVNTNN